MRRLFEGLLSFVYPEVCQLCEGNPAGPRMGFVCEACQARLERVTAPFCERCGLPFEGEITPAFECSNCRTLDLHFTSARSMILAKGAGLDIIHRYKYHRALWFEPLFLSLIQQMAAPEITPASWDAIVPVPLHPLKQREREFNQAERLSDLLSQATRLPRLHGTLTRRKATETQTQLSRKERARNVASAFAPNLPLPSNCTRLILFDDVFTTGATTSECAKVLHSMGAKKVGVWTLARGL